MTRDEYVRHVRESADTYKRTIETIVCLQGALLHDKGIDGYPVGACYLPCRRMHDAHGKPYTPDLVVQLPDDVGVVGDVKITLSTSQDCQSAEEQLRAYDQPLAGWWMPGQSDDPLDHDLCLVVDHLHKQDAYPHFEQMDVAPRHFALVAVARIAEAQTYMAYELFLGGFRAELLSQKLPLDSPQGVPLEAFAGPILSVYFSDAAPPCVEYTMDRIWQIADQVTTTSREVLVGKRPQRQRRVSVADIRDLFRKAHALPCHPAEAAASQPSPPKTEWISNALDAFVEIGWAQKEADDGIYWLVQKEPPKDRLETMARQVWDKRQKGKKGEEPKANDQLVLPLPGPD